PWVVGSKIAAPIGRTAAQMLHPFCNKLLTRTASVATDGVIS
ncbi:uncharacterized protein METZ01_LOCUS218945, partial [marine metagenome]